MNTRSSKFCKAINSGNKKRIVNMLKKGQDANAKNVEGIPAIQLAIFRNDLSLVKYGADINFVDDDGRTALFYAKVRTVDKLVNFLLDNGASTDIVDYTEVSISDLDDDEIRGRLYEELFDF